MLPDALPSGEYLAPPASLTALYVATLFRSGSPSSHSSAEVEYGQRCHRGGVAPAAAPGATQPKELELLCLFRNTLVHCDNVSAIYLSTSSVQHQRTKHVKLDLYFVCEQVVVGDVQVHVWITSRFADIFIKGISISVFEKFRFSLKHLVWLEFQLQGVRVTVFIPCKKLFCNGLGPTNISNINITPNPS
jgi:hypothetical protein